MPMRMVLIDAKGPGYANFVRNGAFRDWWNGRFAFLDQANRQVTAAKGIPIEWHFAEQRAAEATAKFFSDEGVSAIKIKVTPRR